MAIQQQTKKPIERLFDTIYLERKDINLLFVLTFGYGLLGIATPIAVQALVNIVTMGGVLQPLFVVSFILFALLLLSGALYVFEAYVVELIQRRLFVRTSINVANNTQGIDTSVYDHANPVELMNRFFDVTTVQKSAAILLTVGLNAFLQGFIGSIILIFYNFYFGIIIFILLILLAFIIFVLGNNGIYTAIDESKSKYTTAAWLETIARNFYIFKFFNGLERTKKITNELANTYLEKRNRHFKILLNQNIGAVILYAFVGTSMLALGGALVIQGQINLGQFVAAELIIFGVLAAFVRFISKLEYFYDILAGFDKIGVLDDLPQEMLGQHEIEGLNLTRVAAKSISFQYSPRIQTISDISFQLNKGESLAILGESGTGKSTLVGIVTGLRQASIGHIEFNNNDLRQLNQNSLRNLIGIASRVEIVEGSIIDNILLSRPNITLGNVNLVLNELGLLDDFSNLEQSLDTQLTAFGAPLSTTQIQRLMLARAIVSKPSLLIIDGLLDALTNKELDSVLSLLNLYKADWMVLVTTRFKHIADKFDGTLQLTSKNGEHK
jgi:ABC-type bacteriocin/lantibiotic exporter with double-glycine peptidase domain